MYFFNLPLPAIHEDPEPEEEISPEQVFSTEYHSLLDQELTLIGAGNFGEVFKIEAPDGLIKAVKKIELSSKDKNINEADIHKQLKHDYIVNLDAHGLYSGHYYLIMEYAAQGDLFDYIEKLFHNDEHIDWNSVGIPWMYQISLAIAYLHQLNILHRDIKPENIFITSSNTVKLGDFGSAQEIDPGSSVFTSDSFYGSVRSAAPESILGSDFIFSKKTDIYALGIVMWQLETLSHPWYEIEEEGFEFIANMQKKATPFSLTVPSHDELPQEMESITTKCLSFFPEKRPTADDLVKELESINERPSCKMRRIY